jgi:hypothetical protein
MTRSRSESSLKSDFLSVKTGIASLTALMFYMDPVTPCYTAEQTVTHEDLSSSSFKEHSLGRAN